MSGHAAQVKEHMEVVGSDGKHVGTVDHMDGDRIKLTRKDDPDGSGQHHHFIPASSIAAIEGNKVKLSMPRRTGRRRRPPGPARPADLELTRAWRLLVPPRGTRRHHVRHLCGTRLRRPALGFGEKPGIVVVDFQLAFTDPGFAIGGAPHGAPAVGNTAPLIDGGAARRRAGDRLLHVLPQPARAPHWKVAPVLGPGGRPPARSSSIPRIAAAGPDVVLSKGAPSIFFGTPAAAILTKDRVDTMIVTGCITSGCVRASVVDASASASAPSCRRIASATTTRRRTRTT